MKNILYLLFILSFVTISCDSDDSIISLEERTKEETTAVDGDVNPQKEAFQTILYSQANGWKTVLENKKFFFSFNANGLVEADSELPEQAIFTLYEFEKNKEKLILKIEGGGHFSFLDEGKQETLFEITEFTENEIKCTGVTSNTSYIFTPCQENELETIRSQKRILVELKNQDLFRGVIRDGDNFVAHYVLDYDNNKIQFSYVENRILKHVEKAITMETTGYVWTPITISNKTISGLSYNQEQNQIALNGENVASFTLNSNSSVLSFFDNRSRQFQISKTLGIGDAKQELYDETAWDKLYAFEVNCTMGKRPLVAILQDGGNVSGYLFYDVTEDDDAPLTRNGINDVVYFTDVTGGGNPLWGGTEANKTESKTKINNFLAAWFHEDGLILVKENAADGNTYLYFLSTTTDSWFKAKKSA